MKAFGRLLALSLLLMLVMVLVVLALPVRVLLRFLREGSKND